LIDEVIYPVRAAVAVGVTTRVKPPILQRLKHAEKVEFAIYNL
jgi:hypothetical protein